MNGTQYEEFCRLFLANELQIPIEAIRSCRIQGATQYGSPEYSHQIDFYWEEEKDLTLYKNIADAKWRGSRKVNQRDIVNLQQAKEGIAAHKAMMITNTDFTDGARSLADNKGIALHIVCPNFDYSILNLSSKDREKIQNQLRELFSNDEPYIHTLVCKGVDLGTEAADQSSIPSETVPDSKGRGPTHSNKMVQPRSYIQKVQGGRGGPRTGGRGGAVQKGTGPARGSGGRSNRGK